MRCTGMVPGHLNGTWQEADGRVWSAVYGVCTYGRSGQVRWYGSSPMNRCHSSRVKLRTACRQAAATESPIRASRSLSKYRPGRQAAIASFVCVAIDEL